MNEYLFTGLSLIARVALRVGGLLTFSPFFGDRAVPNQVKAGLLVVLTALLVPVVPKRPVVIGPTEWTKVVLGEFLVGSLIGLSLQVVFEGMQFAGQVSGIQLGLASATLFDPLSAADSPVLTVFYNLIALLMYLQLNVHHWVLRALERSFEYLPVGSAVPGQMLTQELVRVMGGLFVLGIQIAAPVMLATLMIDIVVGFLSKASPQLPAMLMSIPVKTLVGYALLSGAVALWPMILERRFAIAIQSAEHMLHLAQ